MRRRLPSFVFLIVATLAAAALTARSRGAPGTPEATHITPPPQPPLAVVPEDGVDTLREVFNRHSNVPRLLVMLSPTCPYCLRGAAAITRHMAADTMALHVLVIWEPVTPSDRKTLLPTTSVLSRMSDPRVEQWWDPGRALSKRMMRDLPRDTLSSVAEFDSTGNGIAWDCVALFGPGKRWRQRFPVPDWAGQPIIDVVDSLPRRLEAIRGVSVGAGH